MKINQPTDLTRDTPREFVTLQGSLRHSKGVCDTPREFVSHPDSRHYCGSRYNSELCITLCCNPFLIKLNVHSRHDSATEFVQLTVLTDRDEPEFPVLGVYTKHALCSSNKKLELMWPGIGACTKRSSKLSSVPEVVSKLMKKKLLAAI